MPKTKKVVRVTWVDSFFDTEVHSERDLASEDDMVLIHSVGHLIRETEKLVTIGMDYDETNDNYRHVCRIRRENVRGIYILGEEG